MLTRARMMPIGSTPAEPAYRYPCALRRGSGRKSCRHAIPSARHEPNARAVHATEQAVVMVQFLLESRLGYVADRCSECCWWWNWMVGPGGTLLVFSERRRLPRHTFGMAAGSSSGLTNRTVKKWRFASIRCPDVGRNWLPRSYLDGIAPT
jgi:hypothetical protein